MSTEYEQLVQYMDDHEFRYRTNTENESVQLNFGCDHGSYRIYAWVDADDGLFQILGFAHVRVPEGSQPAVAETLTRANYGLRVGNFEMDMNDGELRYHVAHILGGSGLESESIRRMIVTAIAMLDRYLPAVLSVVYGNESSADAIRCVEAV